MKTDKIIPTILHKLIDVCMLKIVMVWSPNPQPDLYFP